MPLNIKSYSGDPMPLTELLSIFMHNLRQVNYAVGAAHQHLDAELYDAEYDDFGNERAHPNPYPLSLAAAKKEYEEEQENFRDYVRVLTEQATFPSLDVADDLAAVLGAQHPKKRFEVRIERQGEAELLTVTDGGDICAVVDVDAKINAESRRNTLENEKLVGGVRYALYDFLEKEDRDFYDCYKDEIHEILATDEGE